MARKGALLPHHKEEILKRAQAGESYRDIAEDYGVTPTAIAYHAKPVIGSRVRKKLTDQQIREAVAQWRNGATVAELARAFGVGHTSMTKHITRVTNEPIGRVKRLSVLTIPKDPVELAYFVGILDGEGCISHHKASDSWTVAVTNTSSELEDWLRGVGGHFYYPPRRASFKFDGTFTKQRFEWKVGRAWDVLTLLDAVSPYLRIKSARSKEAMADIRRKFGDPPPSFFG